MAGMPNAAIFVQLANVGEWFLLNNPFHVNIKVIANISLPHTTSTVEISLLIWPRHKTIFKISSCLIWPRFEQ